jgi:catechol 2,3-dioxygenase-like lactoylglutathione lyase family enzyme
MQQRVSVITLGVRDLARSRAFYESLGWRSKSKPEEGVVFFQAGCMVLALWGRKELMDDSGVVDSGGWGGMALAYNVSSPQEVDDVLAQARAAGARITRTGGKTFWGGYNGVFIDPDGHPWEVAHNPFWTRHQDGSIELPGA